MKQRKHRRNLRAVKAVIIGVLVLGIGMAATAFAEEEDSPEYSLENPQLYAQSAVLMDGKSGRILWEQNGDTVRPMASTTKIMTCILALEGGLGEADKITEISSHAAGQPQVHLGMRAGQKFYTRDILYSLMLESHNDSAVAIAEAAAGSVEEFARQMNRKARELGCEDTWFITPNGLDGKMTDEDGNERIHSTTAEDLARIMRYCISESPKAEEFLTITRTADYSFQDADGKGNYHCHNHNALLTMVEGAISGKTGFTSGAGYCYTGAVEDEGRIFIVTLLGCGWPPHKTYKWSDVRELLAYGKKNYQYRNIYRECELPALAVREGVEGEGEAADWGNCTVEVVLGDEGEKELSFLVSAQDKVKIVRNLPEALDAPVRKGEKVGTVEYFLNDQTVASYPVVTAEAAKRFSFEWCLRWVGRMWLGVFG